MCGVWMRYGPCGISNGRTVKYGGEVEYEEVVEYIKCTAKSECMECIAMTTHSKI